MKTLKILVPMHLAGQGETRPRRRHKHIDEAGYAMAALIVGLTVMAVLMTVAMPVWKQNIRREKEEEFVFRAGQYAHAIALFQRKFANAYPPSIDALIDGKFLRKKYKDPITDDDFVPVMQSTQVAATNPGPRGQPPPATGAGRGAGGAGGIVSVTSKSKDVSIRLVNGRSHYNEWIIVYVPPAGAPGTGGRGGQAGQPGQPGQQAPGPRGTINPPAPGPGGLGGFPGSGGGFRPSPPSGPGGPGGRFGPPNTSTPNPTPPGRR